MALPEASSSISDPTKRRALGVVFLIVVVDLLGFGVLLPLLGQYGKRLNASDLEIGLLSASFSFFQFLFSPLWGRLSDRVGRRPVLMGGLVASAAFYLLFAYAAWKESLVWMFVSRIGAGTAGATIATAQAYVADCTSKAERTRSMALIGMAFGLGFVIGPMLGIGAFFAFNATPTPEAVAPISAIPGLLAAALSTIALVLAIFLLPESLHRSEEPREADARFDAGSWRMVFSQPTLPWIVAAFFISTLGFTQFEGTLSLVLYVAFDMHEKQTFGVFLYFGLMFALAQGLLVRRLAKRVPDETLAQVGALLILVGMLLGMGAHWVRSFWTLMAVMPVAVCGFAMTTPSLQSMVSKRAPVDRQGAALGVNQSASALGRVIGMFMGPVLLGVHFSLPYISTAALMVAVIAALRWKVANGENKE
jgi:MFS transporter, DHA1 family, tetracycline resistance protein